MRKVNWMCFQWALALTFRLLSMNGVTGQSLRPSKVGEGFTTEETSTTTTLNSRQQQRHLKTVDDLIPAFQQAKAKYHEQLKRDYGVQTFEKLFFWEDGTTSAGRVYHVPASGQGGISWWRMQRKLMMKILKYMIDGTVQPFIWASGGHSAAAGHGNLYNESYTAVLERNGKDIFAAVGMELKGRNYAMGSTSSAWEIASCIEEIFGMDIDLLHWDYGMTDGRNYEKMAYYFYRAGHHPNRPACITGDLGGNGGREDVMRLMDKMGLPSFFRHSGNSKKLWTNGIPDAEGLTQDQVDAMPPFVRALRCGNQFEKGEPFCNQYKFTNTHDDVCEKRKFRVSWHPGWKWQALEGNMKTIFLTDLIDDALHALKVNGTEPATLLQHLADEEDADYNFFHQSPIPTYATALGLSDEEAETIFRRRSVCHTARLPAEARFLGAITNTAPGSFNDYDKGVSMVEAHENTAPAGGIIPLAYNPAERQPCHIHIQADFKDMFYVTSKAAEFLKLILPNDAEKRIYGHKNLSGMIAICVAACGFGKCEKGCLESKLFNTGSAGTILVNGSPVLNMTSISDNCGLLKGSNGHVWNANTDGQYEVSFKADGTESYLRFSSLIIW